MSHVAIHPLEAWRASGRCSFPNVYQPIQDMALMHLRGRRALDLGCGYGLLGAALLKLKLVDMVVGVDANVAILTEAAFAGVPIIQHPLKVERGSFPDLLAAIRRDDLNVIIARHSLPEIFGNDLESGRLFAHLVARAGIKEMIVEGRVISPSATNPLQSIAYEVKMLSEAFREVHRAEPVSYLVAR